MNSDSLGSLLDFDFFSLECCGVNNLFRFPFPKDPGFIRFIRDSLIKLIEGVDAGNLKPSNLITTHNSQLTTFISPSPSVFSIKPKTYHSQDTEKA